MNYFILEDGGIYQVPDNIKNFELPNGARLATQDEINSINQPLMELVPDYADLRRVAYPDWQTLADAMVEKENGNPEKWQAYLEACAEVKKKYPKSE
jgi:hypothetical protein